MALDMNAAVKITASVNGQQAIDQLRTSMDRLRDGAASAGKMLAVGFVGLQAIQGVTQFAGQIINAADELNKMSQRTGLAVESLSALSYAADLSGNNIEEVVAAMTKLAVKATDAAAGSKSAATTFNALGVSVKDVNGNLKNQETLFNEVAAVIRGINDPTLKAAIAVEVFGKSGAKLIPLINSMEDLKQEAKDLGVVMGSDFAASSEQFNDNVSRMGFLAKGLAKTILADLIPAVNRLMESMIDASKVGGFFSSMGAGLKQMINNTAVDYVNVDQSIQDIQRKVENLKKMREDLTKDTFANKINNALFSDVETIDSQLKNFATVLKQLEDIKRKAADAGPSSSGTSNASAQAILTNLSKANTETVKLTDAQKAAKRAEEERAAVLRNLSDEVLKLAMGEEFLTLEKMRRLGASAEELDRLKQLLQQQQALKTAAEQAEEAERNKARATQEAIKERYNDIEALAESGKRVFESVRTPLEIYNAELERLSSLLEQGAISQETFGRATKQAEQAMIDAGKKGNDTMKTLEQAVQGFGRQATDAFVDFAFGAKASIGDMASAVLKDIARMIVQMMVMKPLMQSIGGFMGFADGGVFSGGAVKPFANGGVVSTPTLFPMANGTGLMGEAGPEAIMPLRRTASGALGVIAQGGSGQTNNVTVNVAMGGGESTKSDTNTGAALGGMIAKVVQAELLRQKRPGGLLMA